jgi:hypothetical protein
MTVRSLNPTVLTLPWEGGRVSQSIEIRTATAMPCRGTIEYRYVGVLVGFRLSSFTNVPQQLDGLDLYSNIHWPAFFRSFKKRQLTSQLRIPQKISSGWLPVGRIRHRINPAHPDSYPSCLGRNESCDQSCDAVSPVAPSSIPP